MQSVRTRGHRCQIWNRHIDLLQPADEKQRRIDKRI